jgi:large subunit ribosomal protein L24
MRSKQPRKQRKAQFNAPIHRRGKSMSAHLGTSLRKEYDRRSVRVIKGDTILVVRGDEEIVGTEGKVAGVNTRTGRITVEGITIPKADGTETARPIHASNVVVTKLDLSDSIRKEKLMRSKEGA